MRKIDYQSLANILAKTRSEAQRAVDHGATQTAFVAGVRKGAAEDIARDFARVASVNKDEFLKACGIPP